MAAKHDRIIYTTLNDLSTFGGVETMIVQEVKFLAALGYHIEVISPPPKGALRLKTTNSVSNFHFPAVMKRLWWPVRYGLLVLWICNRVRTSARDARTIAVSFTVMDGAGPALAKLLGCRVKTILRIVGPFSFEVSNYFPQHESFGHRAAGRLSRSIELFSYLMADSILPVSEFEERNIRSYGVSPSKIRIVRCGIDESIFDGRKGPNPLQILDKAKVVMFVGRMVEKNGPLVIADATPAILRDVPESVVVLVGDGPLKPVIAEKLSKEILSGRVIMTGTRSDIPDLHSRADVYIGHVSSKVDGLGQTVFEAMMSGIPVVAGRDYISEKIITDGEDGLLVSKDDPPALAASVVRLLRNRELRERMGKAARVAALKDLSFSHMMQEVLKEF